MTASRLFLVSAVAAGLLTAGVSRAAFERHYDANICQLVTGGITRSGAQVRSTSSSTEVTCPLPDDTNGFALNATAVYVYVTDKSTSTQVTARLCMSGWVVPAVTSCDTSLPSGNAATGDVYLSWLTTRADPTAFNGTYMGWGYPYVDVLLPNGSFVNGIDVGY